MDLLKEKMIPFPDKKYQIIVADPPWEIVKVKQDLKKFNRPASFKPVDYPMMSLARGKLYKAYRQ